MKKYIRPKEMIKNYLKINNRKESKAKIYFKIDRLIYLLNILIKL